MFRNDYTGDWPSVSRRVKDDAGWRCVRCNHEHDLASGHVLTVHHFDGDKANNAWWNLLALCQRCHLSFQSRVDPDQPYFFEHSHWLKVYVAGFYAHKYLGEEITREEAWERLVELLALEQMTA